MTKRILFASCLTAVGMAIAAPAAAQETFNLRLSHWLPPTHPLQATAFEPWARSIEQASGGTIKVSIFPAQQLGQAVDHYDMAATGIADVTFINPGYQPGRFPIISAGEIPFQIANAVGGSEAFDAWYRQYADEEMEDVKFCMAHLHDPGTFHSVSKPIRVPEDVRGMKVRPAHATMGQFVTLLGGSSVQVSAPESREALERGVADAITFPWNSINLFGMQDVVKYHLDAPLYVTTFAWLINQNTYDRMSDEQKAVIDAHCTSQWARKAATEWAADEAEGRDILLSMPGHEGIVPSASEIESWRAAAQPLHDSWAETVRKAGHDPDAIKESLDQQLQQHGAAY